MNKKMRRFRQQLSDNECIEILCNTTSGVLALCGEDKQPYGVPLSHIYDNGKLYFHSAPVGLKIDLLGQNNKSSFTVIAQDEVHPEKFTTYFRSVIVFGSVRIIDDETEKMRTLEILGHRCNPGDPEGLKKEIEKGFARCIMLELLIERITGKQAIELVKPK